MQWFLDCRRLMDRGDELPAHPTLVLGADARRVLGPLPSIVSHTYQAVFGSCPSYTYYLTVGMMEYVINVDCCYCPFCKGLTWSMGINRRCDDDYEELRLVDVTCGADVAAEFAVWRAHMAEWGVRASWYGWGA